MDTHLKLKPEPSDILNIKKHEKNFEFNLKRPPNTLKGSFSRPAEENPMLDWPLLAKRNE